jgi:hypothetical protein
VLSPKPGYATVTSERRNLKSPVRTLRPIVEGGYGHLTIARSATSLTSATETVDGFATTLLPRTLVDFAGAEGARPLAKAWREADYLGLLDPAAIRAELDANPRPGATAVRERLVKAAPLVAPGTRLRSRKGEYRFLAIVREAGLPLPLVNVPMIRNGIPYEADFVWFELRLVVEVDGPLHDRPEYAAADQVRDSNFFVDGFDVLRISTERMKTHRAWCRQLLCAAHERQHLRLAAMP